MTTIGFLHTADVHVPTFRALSAELAPGRATLHLVDATLLADARAHGPRPELADRLRTRLRELTAGGAGLIVCTCSTIGAVAEALAGEVGVPVLRADRPMAEAAVAAGTRIAVVVTTDSTLAPTLDLLRESAARSGARITLAPVRCPAAWDLFLAGDLDGYAREVAARARSAAPAADVLVLAQASMAPAAALLADLEIPVLTSPRSAVRRAAGMPG